MSRMWQVGVASVLGSLVLPVLVGAGFTGAAAAADGQERQEQAGDQRAREGAQKKKDKRGVDPGDTRGARVVKAGWWWAANEPPPETGLLAAPQAPTPTTPKGSLPVGAVAGDPEKVSALEVRLRAKTGATVKRLHMVLRESATPGANAGAETARILACPVTELFWADGSAAAWKDRPAYDCDTKAVGKRTDDGLWRFDLTAIATEWVAEGNTNSRSVVLVEDVEAPESFQVTLDGVKDEGIGLSLAALPPLPTEETPETPDATTGTPDTGADDGGSPALSDDGGSLGGGGSPALVAGGSEPRAAEAPEAAPAAADTGEVAMTPVAGPPAWYSGLSRTTLLLIPLVLGLAYLVMVALGPDARPVPATGRHGVSRALDRLRQAGRDLRAAR